MPDRVSGQTREASASHRLFGFSALRKGRAFCGCVKAAAIELKSQPRSGLNVALGLQIA